MKVEIHELTQKEFDDAVVWYEMQNAGLGNRFKKTVIEQIKRIKKNPTWFLVEDGPIYKVYIPKFPYKILDTVEEQRIIIGGIAHLHRKPWYWQTRMK